MAEPALPTGERPKRVRKAPTVPQPLFHTPVKRKSVDDDRGDDLSRLLTHPKSKLTTSDMSHIINVSTWATLSRESQAYLCTLLPQTALKGFTPSFPSTHPSRASDICDVSLPDTSAGCSSPAVADPAVFTDPHFTAALLTFQDHLYSSWLTAAHGTVVETFKRGLLDGSMHAPYKDETWAQSLTHGGADSGTATGSAMENVNGSSGRTLADLIKHDAVREGDVLAYKRHFGALAFTVEKDVLVQSTSKNGVTVLMQLGSERSLPPATLSFAPAPPDWDMRCMTITSPSQLESGVLDLDGRVERSSRPNGNAWRNFTVFRWREDTFDAGAVGPIGSVGEDGELDLELLATMDRGGRENHGTLYYLRGCCGE